MQFLRRWRITGTLTTRSPLHIGDGGITTRDELKEKDSGPEIEIGSVATDWQGRAYIPGMTLKGCLRSWVAKSSKANDLLNAEIESAFGSQDPEASLGGGGRAEFCDAFVVDGATQALAPPYWNAKRRTGIAASVALDRHTRTASDQKLFHREFVPPGIAFSVGISGQDLEGEDDLIPLLLFVIGGFNNDAVPVALGSDTGDGWGRMEWVLGEVQILTKEQARAWLDQPGGAVGYQAVSPVGPVERQSLLDQAISKFEVPSPASITLVLRLAFLGPFLVNDPSQSKRGQRGQNQTLPDHTPLRNHGGRVVLPARSIRGAIRSQAERILRTFSPTAACPGDGSSGACKPITSVEEVTRLCPACYLFGAPGWKAPLRFSSFEAMAEDQPLWQEFIAIDRFTGGGAEHLKFNAASAYRPVLRGTMSLDLGRRSQQKDRTFLDPWCLALIIQVLRDLVEEDIPLGFGSGKGYGACTAELEELSLIGVDTLVNSDARYAELLKRNGLDAFNWSEIDLRRPPPMEVQFLIGELVDELRKTIERRSSHEQVS